jgi:hypothetical protein
MCVCASGCGENPAADRGVFSPCSCWCHDLSRALLADPEWVAQDQEAQRLIESGELGPGVTSAELRARYGR